MSWPVSCLRMTNEGILGQELLNDNSKLQGNIRREGWQQWHLQQRCKPTRGWQHKSVSSNRSVCTGTVESVRNRKRQTEKDTEKDRKRQKKTVPCQSVQTGRFESQHQQTPLCQSHTHVVQWIWHIFGNRCRCSTWLLHRRFRGQILWSVHPGPRNRTEQQKSVSEYRRSCPGFHALIVGWIQCGIHSLNQSPLLEWGEWRSLLLWPWWLLVWSVQWMDYHTLLVLWNKDGRSGVRNWWVKEWREEEWMKGMKVKALFQKMWVRKRTLSLSLPNEDFFLSYQGRLFSRFFPTKTFSSSNFFSPLQNSAFVSFQIRFFSLLVFFSLFLPILFLQLLNPFRSCPSNEPKNGWIHLYL